MRFCFPLVSLQIRQATSSPHGPSFSAHHVLLSWSSPSSTLHVNNCRGSAPPHQQFEEGVVASILCVSYTSLVGTHVGA